MKKISIITVCYNSENTIEQTIQSVLSQNYQNLEYIIIDGSSTDNTIKIVNRYKDKISKIISEPDRGLYDAMNKGIQLATGYLIGLLNSDDAYADANILNQVGQNFEKDPALDICYGDLDYVNPVGKIVRRWRSGAFSRYKYHLGWMPPHPTFFVRKSIYQRCGLFDLDFKIAADYELMLRLLMKHKFNVEYIDQVLVRMRIGGASNRSLTNIIKANREVALAWKKNNLFGGALAPFLKPAQKIFQLF